MAMMTYDPIPYVLSDPADRADHGLNPVDSRTRQCCGGIGGHAHDCRDQLPTGAVSVDDWDGDGRLFVGATAVTIEASGWLREDVRISTGGVQRVDGKCRWEVWAGPVHPDNPLSAAQARQIGEALIAAADELDTIEAAN